MGLFKNILKQVKIWKSSQYDVIESERVSKRGLFKNILMEIVSWVAGKPKGFQESDWDYRWDYCGSTRHELEKNGEFKRRDTEVGAGYATPSVCVGPFPEEEENEDKYGVVYELWKRDHENKVKSVKKEGEYQPDLYVYTTDENLGVIDKVGE